MVTKYSSTTIQQGSETTENLICHRTQKWSPSNSNSAYISYFPMHTICKFPSHAPWIISSATLSEERNLWAPYVNFSIFLLLSLPFEAKISLQHTNICIQRNWHPYTIQVLAKMSMEIAFHCRVFLNVPVLFPLYVTDDVINDVNHFDIDPVAQ